MTSSAAVEPAGYRPAAKRRAEPHLFAAPKATEQTLADDHSKLVQRTFFAVPSSDQERLAV